MDLTYTNNIDYIVDGALRGFLIVCIIFFIIQNICKTYVRLLTEAYRRHAYVTII